MKAAFIQTNPVFGNIESNTEHTASRIATVDADLIVLPELFSTGYQFISKEETMELSEEVPDGFTTQRLIALSQERGAYIVAGIAEREGDTCYNSAVLTGPEGFLGVYRKTHLFFEEKRWFAPGDTGFRVWKTPIGAIGIMICFDWFFPESARTLALMGAEIIAHPSNLVLPFCPDAMVTRCLENRVFAVTANRVGTEKRDGVNALTFIGRSEIVSPKGAILCRASGDKQESGVIDIDPSLARNKDLNPLNNLFTDRRPEFYKI
ncbi:MAG: acyltransferase [Thermodesulfovibrio sp.]|nr:acyltransferase [Thermodesulfovibrio sp.]